MNALATRLDATGLALAVMLHGSAMLYLLMAPVPAKKRVTTVEVEIRKPPPPPPPITPPEPPKPEPPPEPPKKIVKQLPRPAETPPPAKKVDDPPPEPPKPVFGIDPSQTGGEGISVPTGNTTIADPQKRPKVEQVPPLPPASGAPGTEYHPVGEELLAKLPEHAGDECGPSMKEKWSNSETHAQGKEGEVVLRIELDERGKVRSIKKIKGLSTAVDNLAMGFLRFDSRCKFGPAIGKDGKPAAYVIERYSIRFEQE